MTGEAHRLRPRLNKEMLDLAFEKLSPLREWQVAGEIQDPAH